MKKLLALLLMLGSMAVTATPVNVNTADAATIADALHGIGLKKAQEIIAYRTANGPFKSVEELGNVKGIGDKTLAKNKADILLSGEGSAPVAPAAKAAKTAKAAAPVVAPAPVAAPATAPVPAAAPATVLPKVTKDVKSAVANPLR